MTRDGRGGLCKYPVQYGRLARKSANYLQMYTALKSLAMIHDP